MELLRAPPFDVSFVNAVSNPIPAVLHIEKEMIGKPGSFKAAYRARLEASVMPFPDSAIFKSGDTVCVKQAITKRGRKYEPVEDSEALKMHVLEARSLEYAHCLTQLTYTFVDNFLAENVEDHALNIPRFSYVPYAIFIAEPPSSGQPRPRGGVLLVEQLLEVKLFKKYLGNSSVIPWRRTRTRLPSS